MESREKKKERERNRQRGRMGETESIAQNNGKERMENVYNVFSVYMCVRAHVSLSLSPFHLNGRADTSLFSSHFFSRVYVRVFVSMFYLKTFLLLVSRLLSPTVDLSDAFGISALT
jgi:hypothetical protein